MNIFSSNRGNFGILYACYLQYFPAKKFLAAFFSLVRASHTTDLKSEVPIATSYCLPSSIQMDMDLDMDIPLPEELELLESSAYLDEVYPDLEPPELYPEEDQEPPPAAQPPPSPDIQFDSEVEIIDRKRSRSDSPDESLSEAAVLPEEKRSRTDDSARETDQDWLRYSPRQRSDPVVAELKEKKLSRYASEIDGECIPVTAPNGDRVYAKLNRLEGEERLKKLDVRANSNGRMSYIIIGIDISTFVTLLGF